jgi:hypothetical protein
MRNSKVILSNEIYVYSNDPGINSVISAAAFIFKR